MYKPPPLAEEQKINFQTLKLAVEYEDVALVSAVRKRDGRPVALICAMNHLQDGKVIPIPLAEIINGNPYDLYYDPTRNTEETADDRHQ